MKTTIEQVDNGFIITIPDYEGTSDTVKIVHECSDEEFSEVDAFEAVLWSLVEYFGFYGSKHDEKRIHIDVRPGDNFISK